MEQKTRLKKLGEKPLTAIYGIEGFWPNFLSLIFFEKLGKNCANELYRGVGTLIPVCNHTYILLLYYSATVLTTYVYVCM